MLLEWTQPTLYGYLSGYMINGTTPVGEPADILVPTTGTTSTSYLLTGLTPSVEYSFRVSAITIHGTNVTTANIANATVSTLLEIGNINLPNGTNPDSVPIKFQTFQINDTSSNVKITYDSDWMLACDLSFKFAHQNTTYTGLPATPAGTGKSYTNFTLINPDSEVIDIYCWDTANLENDGRYRVTHSNTGIPLLSQVNDFQDGLFGTSGMFGALDLMTLIIVIVSMIGFNREHPIVGVSIMFTLIGVMGYYGFIQVPTIVLSAIILVFVLAYGVSKRD
jgi:hypothetical protein